MSEVSVMPSEETSTSTNDSVRWGRSPEDDRWYRIDDWSRAGNGTIIPTVVQEVDLEEVPANWRTTVLERELDE